MLLSGEEIKKNLGKDIIIEPFRPSQLNPNSYNLRLSNELLVYDTDTLDMKAQNPVKHLTIPESGLLLEANKLYLGRTVEYTKTDRFVPMLEGRSSVGRLGLFIHVTAGFGDFKLEFDGDIYLYMLVLSTDKIEALTYKYKTLFEQSERLVKISAAVYDKDERALQETGLMIQPEGTGIYIKDANGKLALIGVGVEETDAEGNKKTVIKLTADNIKLEGLVTANGNFKISEDGSIEANNAKIKGYVYSVFKQIEKSDAELLEAGDYLKPAVYKLKTNLYVDASSCEVVLPVTKEYEGARVLIMDSHFIKTRTVYPPTNIRTEDGSPIVSGLFAQSATNRVFRADLLTIDAGCIELILQNIVCEESAKSSFITAYKTFLASNPSDTHLQHVLYKSALLQLFLKSHLLHDLL